MGLAASAYASMMAALLPPGRLWRSVGGVVRKLIDGIAEEFARIDARADVLLTESRPGEAVELLPEYEDELGLVAGATTAERQAAITARYVARQRYRPVDIAASLAPLLGLPADEIPVVETSVAQAAATGDPRNVYTFYVLRDYGAGGTYYLARAQEMLDAIAPAHTKGTVIETNNMIVDDSHSLCDRDVPGS